MKKMLLTQGRFALVDDEDFEWLSQWKWSFSGGKKDSGYAVRNDNGVIILMHREIKNPPPEKEIDHKDTDKLNNQKYNLRECTKSQNNGNRPRYDKQRPGKYKGCFLKKDKKKWLSQITINKKSKFLGYFDNEIDAAIAYNVAALQIFGEFARVNVL